MSEVQTATATAPVPGEWYRVTERSPPIGAPVLDIEYEDGTRMLTERWWANDFVAWSLPE